MQATELILSYIHAVRRASGATAVSVFVPTWPGHSDDAFLLHSGPEPAAAELATIASAFAFAKERSTPASDGTREEPTSTAGEWAGTVLLPIPLVTSLWKQPSPESSAGAPTPSRRATDHQPSANAGWVALRFDESNQRPERAYSQCRASLGLAADLASLYLRLYGSLTDPLTGLPGRAEFRSLLRDELARARAEHQPCSLVMFNPDDLAAVNVTHGRKLGDQLLREIVVRAQDALRRSDVLCRYGGAIFAIALRNTGTKAAGVVADKLRIALSGTQYLGDRVTLSFSAGAATAAPGGAGVRDPVDLVGRAEAALALAKQHGGGHTCVWRAGETEAPVVLDRLRCAFTGDQERDYRNMGLLWDTVGLLASGGSRREFARRVVSQLRQTLSTSLAALFEVGPRGLELTYGLGGRGDAGHDGEIAAAGLTPQQRSAVAAAAGNRAAAWVSDVRPSDALPGPVTCAVPLLVGGTLAGVLLLQGSPDEVKFDESDLPFLEGFAGPLGFALERAREADRQREQEEIEKRRLVGELRDLRSALHRARLVHTSPQMDELIMTAHRVADTDATVLISGESGTGKELLAQTVHQMSRRRDRPFVIVDCGAIPSSLIESELFGHERGAFTGANTRSPGRLAQADRGTVLLDEIGELPLEVQSKLLRFVQDRQFTTVGSSAVRSVDVRILAATNRDLSHEVTQGRFRADLYHRLNVISLVIPPLRNRPDDILEIARHFLGIFAEKYHKPVAMLGDEVEDALLEYAWPGNVRELQNRIMRAVIMSTGRTLTPDGLSLPAPNPSPVLTVVGGRQGLASPLALRVTDGAPFGPWPTRPTSVASPADVLSGSAPDAWSSVRAALEGVLTSVVNGPAQQYPPLGRWLANDLVLAAFETTSRVAARAAAVLGLPETTFVRRLRRAQQDAYSVRRPPEWASVAQAVQSLVRVRHPEGQNVLDEAEACLLAGIQRHLQDGAAGAYLLGTSLPTYRRRMALLAEAS